ncbi:MAG: hypothetical protein US83_C0002G0073 [Candidatus Falkowbacteria bacterium GW2011_GWC2_38_22]|uniref:Uncharacterized protein n=1 Tax=Candidatus Falkowbacteria bacterium GW2011_GWE1_38_31 TaxID=1618638 RepID=A0A0G0MAE4_9BACT|nr:MAG: hypothetical protein US73_C0007G0073 [Candidatus Falkowbacteria bacterium GW2011_GWF2_38_1205]KKQ61984.1 MAG: hypothetical protein US83_C0002G0073 [Candidatus Falkowbacteria bacterium GW2011_GWC2_38_22]KKQ63854.1 MAG: hypothetical protein US84_C0003G0044 [Candidatus Falkowbacteria bacterium GW2011_GWF1_38_22]KKQ66111.1 MAG: hypothetical protein US87_C0003G0044 [Candidatus Falkowbacteria bacterium GW2011_GWE2_38_254]KKQ70714.1 MAG: hypothetical protein US91_C0003G0044 [Candidatus Falkowb
MPNRKPKIKEDGAGKYIEIREVSERIIPVVTRLGNDNGINRIKCSYISELTKFNLRHEGFTCEICR